MVRNAAFFTPFHGYITGVKSNGGASLVMENVVCKGLGQCVDMIAATGDHVTITDSLFVDNSPAVNLGDYSWGVGGFRITRSVFFSNGVGAYLYCSRGGGCHVDQCLFLQNDVGISGGGGVSFAHTTLAQNEQAVRGWRSWELSWGGSYNDMLFYENDVAFNGNSYDALSDALLYSIGKAVAFNSPNTLGNVTFLENRIDMKLDNGGGALNRINFLGVGNEYHIHYTGTSLFDMNASLTFWNTTSVDEIEEDIYDARDGSGKGFVRILAAESMPQTPFRHGMYQADSCAGQCGQSWFNTNWSSLISAGTGSFGFFDPDRSLHSGQVLRDALLKGHEAPSGMPLSSYMQDLSDLFGAVSKFQTVGTSTSPLPSTTASTTTTTTTTTTTLAEHLVVGADIIMTDPVGIAENTTWTSADGIRALAVRVEVLPGMSLTIEGSRNSSLVLALDDCGSFD